MAKNAGSTDMAGYVDTQPVRRLANTIETLRGLLLLLTALGTVGWMIASGNCWLAVMFLLYGVISGVTIYVFFGWLEQTLRLLTGIAYNTAFSADLMTDPQD